MLAPEPFSADWISDYVRLINEARSDHPYFRPESEEELRAGLFEDEEFDPAGISVVRAEGRIVAAGFAEVNLRFVERWGPMGFVDVNVLPAWRHQGLGSALLTHSLDYLLRRGMREALLWSPKPAQERIDFARHRGFSPHLSVYGMLARLPAPRTAAPPPGIEIRPMRLPGEEDSLLRVWNGSFSDHYLFAGTSVDWLGRILQLPRTRLDGMFFALDGATPVGFAICYPNPPDQQRREGPTGYFWELGVVPSHRRRGIGRALFSQGLAWLHAQQMEWAELNVVAANERALGLYREFGFEIVEEYAVLKRPLLAPPAH